MDMQDKEFDELFRSKLGELEMEPSKGVWDNIAAEVVMERKSRSALPFISIPASVLVLVGAGLFFIPKFKQDNNDVKHHVTAGVKHDVKSKVEVAPVKIEQPITEPSTQIVATTVASKAHTVKQSIKKQNNSLPVVKVEEAQNTQQIAQVAPKPTAVNDAVIAAVKPDNTPAPALIAEKITPAIDSEVKLPEVNALVAQQTPAKTVASAQPKKRRIRSFGDLINVVVSKVDKRKDKLIEFSSKDDDESLVTGINLGIIRVKKEEVVASNK
ncbi:hypothetical protein [Mucilaginibacter pedocola]|uniref:Uncharacterized protein n=1 Tax=Mucilaginibacter pedocola TaxID=1792845 RepID=A0A1S9PH75_9SPHI|nr:hypothetical protein [Mucilaginibacter pedocola]OOQ60287.1 hypothetical protein BC343_26400 [Mucilaginibacter pedocola]